MTLHPYAGQWFYLLTGTDVLNRRLFKVWDWAINIHNASWRDLAEQKELYSSIYAVRQSGGALPEDEEVVYGNLTDKTVYLIHQTELSEVVLTHEAAKFAEMGVEAYRVVGDFLIVVFPDGRKAKISFAKNNGNLQWIHDWHYDDIHTAMEELGKWHIETTEPRQWVKTKGQWGMRVRPCGLEAEEYSIDDTERRREGDDVP